MKEDIEADSHPNTLETGPNTLETRPGSTEAEPRTLKSLVSTPWKKALVIIQLISYILIVGSPLIGAAIGGLMGLKAAKIGGLIFGIFFAGEVLFYGSLAFLGKEVVLVIRDVVRAKFKM